MGRRWCWITLQTIFDFLAVRAASATLADINSLSLGGISVATLTLAAGLNTSDAIVVAQRITEWISVDGIADIKLNTLSGSLVLQHPKNHIPAVSLTAHSATIASAGDVTLIGLTADTLRLDLGGLLVQSGGLRAGTLLVQAAAVSMHSGDILPHFNDFDFMAFTVAGDVDVDVDALFGSTLTMGEQRLGRSGSAGG